MKKVILTIAITIGLFAGMVWLLGATPKGEGSAQVAQTGTAVLAAEHTNFDFGSISMAKGNVMHEYVVRNTGSAPLTLGKMYTSCMCTQARIRIGDTMLGPFGMPGHAMIPRLNKTLAPGEEAVVEAIFDPAAHGPAGVGRVNRVVTIEIDGGAPLELSFTATVTP